MSATALDTTKAEAFGEDLLNTLNRASIALMISIGHRTGLYDAMADMEPATSAGIAEASGLNERYVREWLGCMVVAGIVEYDPSSMLYKLPPEHAACLTRDAAPDNIAAFAQYIPLLGTVENQIVDCFKNGGGVPYSEFDRFHEVMVEDSGQTVLGGLEEHILPVVPGLRKRLEQGIDVLDVGCGAGRAINLMAGLFPNSRFTGYDFSEEAIGMARSHAKELGLTNATFEVKDVTDLGITDATRRGKNESGEDSLKSALQNQKSPQQSERSQKQDRQDQQAKLAMQEQIYDEASQAIEQQLQRIPDDPAGLLRNKLRLTHQRRYADIREGSQPW